MRRNTKMRYRRSGNRFTRPMGGKLTDPNEGAPGLDFETWDPTRVHDQGALQTPPLIRFAPIFLFLFDLFRSLLYPPGMIVGYILGPSHRLQPSATGAPYR